MTLGRKGRKAESLLFFLFCDFALIFSRFHLNKAEGG